MFHAFRQLSATRPGQNYVGRMLGIVEEIRYILVSVYCIWRRIVHNSRLPAAAAALGVYVIMES